METSGNTSQRQWASNWLSAVADGRSEMSQRKLSSIDKHAGGIDVVVAVAEDLGVHLLRLTDERGHVLIAASRGEFKVLA